jgi:hypothetical protein
MEGAATPAAALRGSDEPALPTGVPAQRGLEHELHRVVVEHAGKIKHGAKDLGVTQVPGRRDVARAAIPQ